MSAPIIAPEVQDRMIQLVRDLHADHIKHGAHDYVQDFVKRTADLVAELPAPVDPDLFEVRECIRSAYGPTHYAGNPSVLMAGDGPARVHAIVSGEGDEYWEVRVALAALKRGRELERAVLAHEPQS